MPCISASRIYALTDACIFVPTVSSDNIRSLLCLQSYVQEPFILSLQARTFDIPGLRTNCPRPRIRNKYSISKDSELSVHVPGLKTCKDL